MIFPQDSEIREYASYYIRALTIFKEEFKNNQGRPPTEFEVQDFSKMGIIPFGLVPKHNGFQKSIQDQGKVSKEEDSGHSHLYSDPRESCKGNGISLFKTEIRMNELRKITLDDIREDVLRVTGKGQKTRDVYLPESMRRGTYPAYLRVRRSKQGVNALFTNMYGEPLTYDGIRGDIYQLLKKAGVHFSPHMARRFYARFLYQQGYDLEVIRLILGHEKLDTTKKYMQIDQKDALDAFRRKHADFFLAEVNLL